MTEWIVKFFISPEDSEEIEGQEEEQNHPDEDVATEEDETSDIAESESSGRNIFSRNS